MIYTNEKLEKIKIYIHDPMTFSEECVKVLHPRLGEVPVKFSPDQKELMTDYVNENLIITCGNRQIGLTTVNNCFALWNVLFIPHQTVLFAYDRYQMAMDTNIKIRVMIENLPDFITTGLKITEMNKHAIHFDNGSRMLFDTITHTTGRGMSVNLLICDNFAYARPDDAEHFIVSMLPALAISSKCIITSYFNSERNYFDKIWNGSEKGINNFKRNMFLFRDHYEYPEDLIRRQSSADENQHRARVS